MSEKEKAAIKSVGRLYWDLRHAIKDEKSADEVQKIEVELMKAAQSVRRMLRAA